MPLNASGIGGLVHDLETRALLLTAERWRLQAASQEMGEPAMIFLSGCRVPMALGVVGGDGGAFETSYQPVRFTLPFGTRLLVVNGELTGNTAESADFEALATSLPVPDLDALNDWPSPLTVTVPLPEDGGWGVRTYPRRDRLEAWRQRLTEDGATVETWHELLAAFDGGWSLGCASPAEMTSLEQWDDPPMAAVDAVADFLAMVVAGTLSPDDPPLPPSTPMSGTVAE